MTTYNAAAIYLKADTANGVQRIDPIDYPEMEVSLFGDFMGELPSLGAGETIFTVVFPGSPDHERVQSEYGIN